MSASEPNTVESASPLNDLPQFDLDYEVDDPAEPTAVTLYASNAADGTTNWMSAAVDTTIDLRDVA